jgi:hypothetical protein
MYFDLLVDRKMVEVSHDDIIANRPNVVKEMCDHHEVGQSLKTSGYSVIYRYLDQDKKPFDEISITGKDC